MAPRSTCPASAVITLVRAAFTVACVVFSSCARASTCARCALLNDVSPSARSERPREVLRVLVMLATAMRDRVRMRGLRRTPFQARRARPPP